MSFLNKVFVSILVLVMFVIAGITLIGNRDVRTLGSVTIGNEYQSTTTSASFATPAKPIVLCSTQGTLGSIIILNKDSGGQSNITLYDGTSTVTNTEWATTTIARVGTSTPMGTYTFDQILKKGLILEYPSGVLASTTITYRCN